MKLLVNPFFWYLLLQSAGLLALQRHSIGFSRAVLRALLLLTLLLTIAATPLTRRGLEASLGLAPTSNGAMAPVFIFVLGGGYLPGVISDEDILVSESQRRVLHGVTLWRRYPDARMVFSGAEFEYEGIRGTDRAVLLMAETARNRGVPAEAVLLEPRSRNTREHPVEALSLPGVTSAIPIAVVTSGWHMRRAQRTFCRYFQQVQTYPVSEVQRPMGWQDFIPDAGTLSTNTTLLREWAGMLWYDILGVQGQAQKCYKDGFER